MSTASTGSSGRSHDPDDNRGAFGSAAEQRSAGRPESADSDRDARRHNTRAGWDVDQDGRTVAQRDQLQARTELELSRSRNRRLTDLGLFLLRLIPLILIVHGINQLRGFSSFSQLVGQTQLGAMAPQVFAGLVAAAHIGLPILIALGILTRFASLLNTVALASIWVFAHAVGGIMDPRAGGLNGEAALLFALVTIPLIFTGAGLFSVDHMIGRGKAQERAERRALKRI